MCFGSKKEASNEPAPRPAQRPSSVDKKGTGDVKATSSYNPPQQDSYQEAALSGPSGQGQFFAPPTSAPPQTQYAPPSGGLSDAPPSYANANPQHDWQAAVPDTSLFPPPPAIFSGFDRSPTSNATEEEAIAGEEWCEQYPLTPPLNLDDVSKGALHFNNIRLMEPTGFNGSLTWAGPGHWQVSTAKNSPDRCMISYPPLYSLNEHNPLRSGQPKTIYYEVKLQSDSPTAFVGMGFTALPYPSFRMPGWHRGSLAVHGDDGHKYINDRWGGKTFTAPFRQGETYGIGMTIKPTDQEKPLVDIFFTRNGVLAGGWNLYEETDAEQDLPVTGLEGLYDLCAAVGTYDGTRFEVIFEPSKWEYRELSW